jgi:hypothetical protein
VLLLLLLAMSCSGVPRDILTTYPVLKEFRNAIATLPEVAAFYAKETDDIRKNGFYADA